ncbi:hypothetical protein ACRAWF_21500 [Streptomyces sp. L7]
MSSSSPGPAAEGGSPVSAVPPYSSSPSPPPRFAAPPRGAARERRDGGEDVSARLRLRQRTAATRRPRSAPTAPSTAV